MKLLVLLLLFSAASCNVIDVNTSDDLVYWLCKGFLNDSSLVLFNKASYLLNASPGFCIIKNVNNIQIKSKTGISSISCNPKESAGFGFINVINVTITGIHLVGCGSTLTEEAVVWVNDTNPHIGYLQKAVLLFNHCHNINISLITISYYYGYAIMIVNPIGHSKLEKVTVTYGVGAMRKSCLSDVTFSCAGSGIMCTFKDTSLATNSPSFVKLVKFKFSTNSNIIFNIQQYNEIGVEMCHLPLVGAAGLSVIFNQTYKATLLCKQCAGNYSGGTLAGNVFILYTNGMYNSKVTIANSSIAHGILTSNERSEPNDRFYHIGGPGITVISILCGACNYSNNIPNSMWSPLIIARSQITSNGILEYNKGESKYIVYGGGTYLNVFDTCKSKFVVQFIGNRYHKNFAVQSGTDIYAFISKSIKGSSTSIIMRNNIISRGLIKDSRFAGYSTLPSITLINWNNVTIDGGQYYDSNSTVIGAYNSQVFLTGNVAFINNRGVTGAAFLLESAYLILQEPLNATFHKNKALLYGGVVYSNSNNIIPRKNGRCSIQIRSKTQKLNNLDIHLNFWGNVAGLAGKTLYIDRFYNCSKFYNPLTIENSEFSWESL